MATWFITGSSRGFGREVALEALRRGEKVVATARDTSAVQDIVDQLGDSVLALPLDVTDAEQVTAAVQAAEEHFGGINIVFNNAGIGYFAAFEESAVGETRRMMEINVFGLAAVAKAVLPGMRARRAGTIVNVSSVGGVRSFPAVSWYNASKFAVEGLSESMAQELAPLGVRIVLVEPSAFATDWAGNSAAETLPEYEIPDYDSTAGSTGATSAPPPAPKPAIRLGRSWPSSTSPTRTTRRCGCPWVISPRTDCSSTWIRSARTSPRGRRSAAALIGTQR